MTTTHEAPSLHPFLDGRPKDLLIGGEWRPALSGKYFDAVNPSTGQVVAQVAEGDRADVDLAVRAARQAFDEGPWSKFKPAQRQNTLLKLADLIEEHYAELRRLEVIEMGQPISWPDDPSPATEVLRFFAGCATQTYGETIPNSVAGSYFTYTVKEPVGVVGSIIPWNGPIMTIAWKLGPVLATGCTMVLKPAEEAPLALVRLGELIQESGILPPGVFNIVNGFGETAGAAITGHPDVDKISFTGSSVTGQEILRASIGNLKRVTLELGGKSPGVILADADLEAASAGAAMGVFMNTGQFCCARSRVFVERPVYDEVVERMSAFARSLKVGNSLDPETQIGPIVSQAQLDRVLGYVEAGHAEGARATAGGARLTEGDLGQGYFVPPTVFADVEDDMRIAKEEIFGPVASVMPFDSVDEVIRRANATQYGLGGAVWTRDVAKAHHLAAAIHTGVVWVNATTLFDPAMPFGGVKMSGWGNDLSVHAIDEYVNVKAVWINTAL